MSLLTKEGVNNLKFAYLVLLAGVAVSIFVIGGSYLYWQSEKNNDQQSQRGLSDVQARLANARREREDLRNSEDTFQAITARGIFVPERRLDLIDAMRVLKTRHRLVSLSYELGNQRLLKLAGGTTISGVEARGSRIRLKASAVHDGDMMAFLDEFPRLQRGFFPIDQCVLKRNAVIERAAAVAINTDSPGTATSTESAPVTLAATLEAECSLEWITLLDKQSVPAPIIAGPGR